MERSGTQENCGGIGSGCRLRLRPLPVLRRRQSQRVARIDPNAVAFLKQQGLVDPDIFIAKTNELTKQLRQVKLEKEKLM